MTDLHGEFLRRYTGAQQSLFAYIRSKGLDLTDAEDVLQDVSVALWESYASYEPSRPFIGWAVGVARNVIHKHQRYQSLRRHAQVDAALLDRISHEVAQTLSSLEGELADERDRMEECMKALPEKARAILALRYQERLELKTVAARIGQSAGAANMLLSRIRAKLLDCVQGARA